MLVRFAWRYHYDLIHLFYRIKSVKVITVIYDGALLRRCFKKSTTKNIHENYKNLINPN